MKDRLWRPVCSSRIPSPTSSDSVSSTSSLYCVLLLTVRYLGNYPEQISLFSGSSCNLRLRLLDVARPVTVPENIPTLETRARVPPAPHFRAEASCALLLSVVRPMLAQGCWCFRLEFWWAAAAFMEVPALCYPLAPSAGASAPSPVHSTPLHFLVEGSLVEGG